MNKETLKKLVKNPIVIAYTIVGLMIAFYLYQFGWKNLEKSIYDKGYSVGQVQKEQSILQSIQQLYDYNQQIKIQNGDKVILFNPVK